MVQIKITLDDSDAQFIRDFTDESMDATAVTSALREWMQAQGYEPKTLHKGRGGKRTGAGRKKLQHELELDALVKRVDELTDYGRNDPTE